MTKKKRGRPPRYGVAMKHYAFRIPEDWKDELVKEFGTLQQGIESLVKGWLIYQDYDGKFLGQKKSDKKGDEK